MKKLLLTIVAIAIVSLSVHAQQVIQLPYYKTTEKVDGKNKWANKWISEVAYMGSSPMLILKKENSTTFSILKVSNLPESEIGVFDTVIYDPTKTEEVRKKNSNPNLTVYKFQDSSSYRYLWTEHATLDEIYRNQSKWDSTKNVKIYKWYSKGGGILYSSGFSLKEEHIDAG